MRTNDKRCRQCGQTKPLREFQLPRHRLCNACRTRCNIDLAEEFITKKHPTAGKIPSLTSTWEGYKKYQRERQRQAKLDKEREAAARGEPVKTPTYSKVKWCRGCQQKKHAMMFRHPRYRLCMACDGPTMNP